MAFFVEPRYMSTYINASGAGCSCLTLAGTAENAPEIQTYTLLDE